MEATHENIKYKFFWNGLFSNWHECYFTVDGTRFNCGEQYMMYAKASTFSDGTTAGKIMLEPSPKKQKELGRQVKDFNPQVWDNVKYDLVKKGLKEKFLQNPEFKDYLLKYKGYVLVEASPYDRIWGIGFYDYEAIQNIDNWGENLLGKVLTELAAEL